ncbi:hypothetical protein Bpfe_025560, partial [Biomphalaria pfeifferi]
MKARSVLLLFPFIMYFAHRTDGCQPSLEATEMQWLEEELADWEVAAHGIEKYRNALRDNPRFKSLKSEMNKLFETLLKELVEKRRQEDEFRKAKSLHDEFLKKLENIVLRHEKRKKLLAQIETLRQKELKRQKEEKDEEDQRGNLFSIQVHKFFSGGMWFNSEDFSIEKWNERMAKNKFVREYERHLDSEVKQDLE